MNELRDRVVMVHPTLTHDPVNMQGHMAKIISVDVANDEVMVRFKNQMLGLYEANALLMLIPGMKILDMVRSDSENLDRYDLMDVLGIYLLETTREEKYRQEPLAMAMSRAELMHATVISVRDYIDLKRDLSDDVEQARGR